MFFVLPTLVFKIRFLTASSRFLQVRQSAARKAKARDAGISCPSETLPVLSEGRNGMCLVSFFKTKNSCVSAVPMSDFQTARCLSLFFFFFAVSSKRLHAFTVEEKLHVLLPVDQVSSCFVQEDSFFLPGSSVCFTGATLNYIRSLAFIALKMQR